MSSKKTDVNVIVNVAEVTNFRLTRRCSRQNNVISSTKKSFGGGGERDKASMKLGKIGCLSADVYEYYVYRRCNSFLHVM